MSAKPEHYDVIRKPVITEKATLASEANAVVFEVAIDANKPQIKEAVEALFSVKVKAVNTVVTKGKVKRFRGVTGTRKDVKKAYAPHIEGLTLAEILIFIRQYPQIMEYLPEEEEITRAGREFICNVAYTLQPQAF